MSTRPPTRCWRRPRTCARRGLVEGTAGNISARQRDGTLVITPSSVDYADMQLDDLVVVDAEGETLAGKHGRSPSSERMLHLACYRAFDDIGAVVHAHPVHATMFAIARQRHSGLHRRVRHLRRR